MFIYISDDLDWGRDNVIKTAKLRNIAIYLAADDTKGKERNRNRNRFVCSLSVAKKALYFKIFTIHVKINVVQNSTIDLLL